MNADKTLMVGGCDGAGAFFNQTQSWFCIYRRSSAFIGGSKFNSQRNHND
jgi:hypothetical protein